jgi:hypothetical protein
VALGTRGLNPGDRDVAGLRRHPAEPSAHRREALQVEAAFVGYVRVGVEGDIADRGVTRDEEGSLHQVPLHHAQGGVSEPPLGLERRAVARLQYRMPKKLACPVGPTS